MKQQIYQKKENGLGVCWLVSFLLLFSTICCAKPDMTPLGTNIADTGSVFYNFSVIKLDSADGKRHYKVWVGVPDRLAPASGFPVLYMLDGNAVMDRLSDELLKNLSAQTAPVIVAVGYQTTLPFDSESRTYDYTPVNNESDGSDRYGRKGGGSDTFRQLFKNKIIPVAEQNVKINEKKRGIWGHSYGGLFVLDAYLSSDLFNFFYAASPSLARNHFALAREIATTNKKVFTNKKLYILEGDGDKKHPGVNRSHVLTETVNMVAMLRQNDVPVKYNLYPGLNHGQMFTPSFKYALLNIAGRQ